MVCGHLVEAFGLYSVGDGHVNVGQLQWESLGEKNLLPLSNDELWIKRQGQLWLLV